MPEAVTGKCSVRKVFFKILHKLQENICAGVSFIVRGRLQTKSLVKKRLLCGYFFVNFANNFLTECSYGPIRPLAKKITKTELQTWIKLALELSIEKPSLHNFVANLSPIFFLKLWLS